MADGHLGIWAALADVWLEVAEQRCWNHKICNVLDRLPRRLQAEARELLRQVAYADTRAEAERRRDLFSERFRSDHPAAADTLVRDWERLVTFYDFPREHWKHRVGDPLVAFAGVGAQTHGGDSTGLVVRATALIWRLLLVAERHFRRLDHPALLPEVALGARYRDGRRIVDETTETNHQEAAA